MVEVRGTVLVVTLVAIDALAHVITWRMALEAAVDPEGFVLLVSVPVSLLAAYGSSVVPRMRAAACRVEASRARARVGGNWRRTAGVCFLQQALRRFMPVGFAAWVRGR